MITNGYAPNICVLCTPMIRKAKKITTYSMFTKNLFIPICNPNFKKNKALNHGGNLFGWVKHPHPSPLPSFPKISKNQSLLLIMFYTKKSCYDECFQYKIR